MAHNDFLLPSTRTSTLYPSPWVPTPKFLSRMDLASSQSVNIVGGGTWSPANQLVIGAASVGSPALLLTTTSSFGAVRTGRNGRLRCNNADIPSFLTPRLRTVVIPVTFIAGDAQATGGAQADVDPTYGCARILAPGTGELTFPIPPHSLVQGATISSATLTMRIGQSATGRTALPANLPSFILVKLRSANLTPLTLTAGYTSFSAADLPSYLNNGNQISATNTATQNQVIDTTTGHYFVSLIDENGANAIAPSSNLVHSLTINMSIPDFRFA